jgi:NADH-quinone oxidoreductase subunit M
MSYLLLLVIIPLLASASMFLFSFYPTRNLKIIAAVMSLIPLAVLMAGVGQWIGLSIDTPWIPALGINFHLEVDGVSLLFLFLTAAIVPVSIVSEKNLSKPYFYYGLVFLLEAFLFGFFTSRDLVVFTLFWEAMLLPMYFIIAVWGRAEKGHAAALKFLIYMIAGSVLMVAAVLALYFTGGGTFDLNLLAQSASSSPAAPWICAIFLLAFAVKTPLFPFHAWLPDAYCEASLGGTILLSGLLSKAGIYGIFRIGFYLFPTYIEEWGFVLLPLSVAGVLYAALAAWRQTDYKRLIAYSSLSHVNFILAGLFIWNETAHSGAILQALNHGITITALFLVAGWLQQRLETTQIAFYTGVAKYLPHLCWLTLIFVLSSVGLPGMNNFVGELMILFGVFEENPWSAALLGLTVILSVVYMLRWMQKLYFDQANPFNPQWKDLSFAEFSLATPLVILVLLLGLYPSPILKQIERTVQTAVTNEKIEEIQ